MVHCKYVTRRGALRLGVGSATALALAGCRDDSWYGLDVAGTLPDLSFSLTRARDNTAVSEIDYRRQVVALFFGFTFCPDVCPTTLANLSAVVDELGAAAQGLSILFVTVDPERDSPDVLAEYAASFTDRVDALYGTDNQLARLTRALRVTVKIEPHEPGARDYNVSHGKSVYIFGPQGDARLIWPQFDTLEADITAATSDIRRLLRQD